jgi:hypothetical protein
MTVEDARQDREKRKGETGNAKVHEPKESGIIR